MINTNIPAIIGALYPLVIESFPRDGPTERSSATTTFTGRAPARNSIAKF